jgi:hypothetical protein
MLTIFLFIESTIRSLATPMVVINHRNIPSGAQMLTSVCEEIGRIEYQGELITIHPDPASYLREQGLGQPSWFHATLLGGA